MAAVVAAVGVDELVLVTALALLTTGLWPHLGRAALTVPGLVLLWIALPQRAGFVSRPREGTGESEARRKRG